jgi:hypothetical protein
MIDSRREQERLDALLERRKRLQDALVDLDKDIGTLLGKMRTDRELSLRDVGILLGCDWSNFSKAEKGRFAPTMIRRVQEYFPRLGIKTVSDDPFSALVDDISTIASAS